MLYFIGLGLGDAKDITVKGLEIVKAAKRVYLEHYTSILSCGKDELEAFYGRNDLVLANRDMVEIEADQILDGAEDENVAFLVVGDPFGATTHSDLMLRAKERNIPVKVIHNASIMNAIGRCVYIVKTPKSNICLKYTTIRYLKSSIFYVLQSTLVTRIIAQTVI